MSIDIASDRAEARLLGYPFYQGAMCKRGHAGVRYVGNKACRDCTAEHGQQRRSTMSEEERATERARKLAAKAAGRWKPVPVEAKRRHHAASRARVAARPENVAKRAARLAELEAQRLERDRVAMAKQEAREAKLDLRASPEYQAELYRRQLERDRLKAKARRAIKRGASKVEAATVADIAMLLGHQGERCAYCGRRGNLQLDHKIAVTRGGRHTLQNLQWLCARHNVNKRTTADLAYRMANGIPLVTPWDGPIHIATVAAALAA